MPRFESEKGDAEYSWEILIMVLRESLTKWPNSDDSREALTGQRVYAKCTHQCFFVYERKLPPAHEPYRKAKLLIRNMLTFVNISALCSAPQFPIWG